MLALDWAKAFDSVDPRALRSALKRFGCPSHFVDMVQAIYTNRTFVVSDNGVVSGKHRQHNGIAQGCPLSPFLFSIVMTVLLHDAKGGLAQSALSDLSELVYADNTLLAGVSEESLQTFMTAIGDIGAEYVLSFMWKKLEVLPVRTTAAILKPDGSTVAVKDSLLYLGSSLDADGRNGSELISTLSKVWAHSSLSRPRKLDILRSCIESKLTYGLAVMTLTKVELRRIDGFQCRCLRKILGIAPSYWSRISNLTVLGISGRQPLSQTLKQERMIYLGSVARRSSADPVRNFVFENDQLNLKPCSETKRRGRPRKAWTDEIWRDCMSVAGSIESLEHYFQATPAATAAWRSAVLGRQGRGCT